MSRFRKIPAWEKLLAHAATLQTQVPGAVLVGGTAAALHAGHRISFDHDHVVAELSRNYDAALTALEAIVGWRTRRRIRGKLILGQRDGIDAGLRNQRRSAPLETTTVEISGGRTLRIPTVEEMLRIKAFLVVERNATRDYLDVAALTHHLGLARSAAALRMMNQIYGEFAGENGDILASLTVRLTHPEPYDLAEVDLADYKGIVPPWDDWTAVESQCRELAEALLTVPDV
ncbi:MAG: nucleotidyl transferase AbiEii/AbiGii toxin family protein [Gammaproteobacteria bacterium]|nr:nucleotidyl transferase AbiEii/AbiGii toxin family protein [Gammaproteobacteria bacterium]